MDLDKRELAAKCWRESGNNEEQAMNTFWDVISTGGGVQHSPNTSEEQTSAVNNQVNNVSPPARGPNNNAPLNSGGLSYGNGGHAWFGSQVDFGQLNYGEKTKKKKKKKDKKAKKGDPRESNF